jgi:hypothetical protein
LIPLAIISSLRVGIKYIRSGGWSSVITKIILGDVLSLPTSRSPGQIFPLGLQAVIKSNDRITMIELIKNLFLIFFSPQRIIYQLYNTPSLLKIIIKWLIRVRRDTSPNAGANLVADRSGGVSPSRHHGNSQRAKKII